MNRSKLRYKIVMQNGRIIRECSKHDQDTSSTNDQQRDLGTHDALELSTINFIV